MNAREQISIPSCDPAKAQIMADVTFIPAMNVQNDLSRKIPIKPPGYAHVFFNTAYYYLSGYE